MHARVKIAYLVQLLDCCYSTIIAYLHSNVCDTNYTKVNCFILKSTSNTYEYKVLTYQVNSTSQTLLAPQINQLFILHIKIISSCFPQKFTPI